MAPLAGDRVRTGDDTAIDDQAAADAGPEDDAEYHRQPGGRAIGRFGKRKAIGVVREPHRAPSLAARSSDSGRPFNHVEFAFFTSPLAGDTTPGMPTPTRRRADDGLGLRDERRDCLDGRA